LSSSADLPQPDEHFDPPASGTMVFDDDCAFREHLDDDAQKVMSEA
jgi:hypothetical protein